MKFKWVKDPHNPTDINLQDLDRERRNVVGWVQTTPNDPKLYEVRFVWCDHDDLEEIRHNTKREAMRALRTAYRMYIIGGGTLRGVP